MKYSVKVHNTTFKIADVQKLFDEALDTITAENWEKAIAHVIKLEDKYWEEAGSLDECIQEIVISMDESSESSSDSDTDFDDEPSTSNATCSSAASSEVLHPRNLYHDYESE